MAGRGLRPHRDSEKSLGLADCEGTAAFFNTLLVVHSAEADVRVGGRFRVAFTSGSDEVLEVSGVYREVVPNRKLVFSWAWKSAPEHESLVTVTFEPSGGGTDLTLLHEQFFDAGERDGHDEGWGNALAKIDAVIASH